MFLDKTWPIDKFYFHILVYTWNECHGSQVKSSMFDQQKYMFYMNSKNKVSNDDDNDRL